MRWSVLLWQRNYFHTKIINPTSWINHRPDRVFQENRAHFIYELFSHYYWFTYNFNFSNSLPLCPIYKLFLTDSLIIMKAREKPHLFQGQTGPTKITTQDSWGRVWNKQIAFGTSLLLIGTTFSHKLSGWCIWKPYFGVIHSIHVSEPINVIHQKCSDSPVTHLCCYKNSAAFSARKTQRATELNLNVFFPPGCCSSAHFTPALGENNFHCLFNENLVMQEVW